MARRLKRLRRFLLAAFALLALAGALTPWWLPAAVVQFGPRWGLSVRDWSGHGWSGTSWRGVEFVRDGLRVSVEELETPVLGVWPRSSDTTLRATNVTVSVTPSPAPAPPTGGAASPVSVVGEILRVWPSLQKWLPPARIDGLTIVAGDGPSIRIDRAEWDGNGLHAVAPWPGRGVPLDARVVRRDGQTLQVQVNSVDDDATADFTAGVGSDAVDVRATFGWLGNRATAGAVFGTDGWLPRTASFEAPVVSLESSRVGLSGYGPVEGNLSASWAEAAWVVRIEARAQPLAGDAALPPLEVDLRGGGDLERVRLEEMHVAVPGVRAELSEPLHLLLPSGQPESPAQFRVNADLAKLPWAGERASGVLEGTVEAVAGGSSVPAELRFELAGRALAWRSAAVDSLRVSGRWSGQELRVDELDVLLPGDGRVRASGVADFAARVVRDGKMSADLAGTALQSWWGNAPNFARAAVEAQVDGSFDALAHRGEAQVRELAFAPNDMLEAEVHWEAKGSETAAVRGELRSLSGVTMPFAAELAVSAGGAISATVQELAWRDSRGEWWHLAQPAALARTPAASGGDAPASWAVRGLRLEGDGVSLDLDGDVQWPAVGRVTVAARGWDALRLASFVPEAWQGLRLESLAAKATWADGPLALEGVVRASHLLANNAGYAVEAELRTDDAGLVAGILRVIDREAGEILAGDGRVALTILGGKDGLAWRLPDDGEIVLRLKSTPNPAFWEAISGLTGWGIAGPRLSIDLAGTVGAPRGRMELAADELVPKQGVAGAATRLPTLQFPQVVVVADGDGLALSEGMFAVDNNWLTLAGRAPWNWWRKWREAGQPDWRGATFSVAAAPLPLSVISRIVPTVLAPEGTVSLDLEHAPGRGFSGRFWLHQAALRPIAPVGAIREIEGEVRIDGYAAQLTQLTAALGGRPLEISGALDLAREDEPDFDLRLRSAGVPLVRMPGLVMRAGLDLKLQQRAGRPAHISGRVEFGKSLVVADLVSLLADAGGGVTTAESRPPYFSVTTQPFADWTLDVAVTGDDFLRVEAPVVRGTFSADLRLDGTLAEPRAIGRIWSQKAAVLFPFATLAVDQAEVSLSAANPYEPRLLATGAARVFGYDVRMNVSGALEEPNLLFSSDPPLASQTVFLMLSTGALPTEEITSSAGARAQRFGMFVGRHLAAGLGLGGGPGDGVERFVVRMGEDFTEAGRETVHVQVDLDGRWSVFGEYDRYDAYNGGIKFRLIDR